MKNKDEKLTLKLKGSAIAKAKDYAKSRGTSVSRLVESYFSGIAEPGMVFEEKLSPAVKELSGVLKMDPNTDFRKEYGAHLERKYGK